MKISKWFEVYRNTEMAVYAAEDNVNNTSNVAYWSTQRQNIGTLTFTDSNEWK